MIHYSIQMKLKIQIHLVSRLTQYPMQLIVTILCMVLQKLLKIHYKDGIMQYVCKYID